MSPRDLGDQQRIESHGRLLAAVVEAAQDAIYVQAPDGTITTWNRGAERLYGYTAAEAIGQLVWMIVPTDCRDKLEEKHARLLRGEQIEPFETRQLRRDAQPIFVSVALSAIVDAASRVVGIAAIVRVVPHKQAEEELNAALEYAENIVNTVREPLLILDGQLRVKTANRSFYQVFQVTKQDTEGRLVYELGNGQWNIPNLRTLLEEILPQCTTFDAFEVTHEFPAVGRRVMLVNARRMHRAAGHTELILLAIEDITERRRLEDEQRELETRFTSLVKNIRDHSIFSLDPQGRITSWNLEAERILGYTEAEALGQDFSIIFTPEDVEAGIPAQELSIAMSVGQAKDERWHARKGGERFWALGIVTPTTDARGTHTGYSKILRDMTDRKRAEQALRASAEQSQAILASLPAHIAVIDRRGNITAVNPAWEAFALDNGGCPERCSVGTNYLHACRAATGEEGIKVAEELQAILDGTANSFKLEYPCHSDNRKHWFLLQAVPLRHDEGGAVVTHTEITDRVEAEQALRAAHQQLEAVIETAPSLIVVTDRCGRIVHFNPACEELTGYRREEVLGDTLLDRFVPAGWRSVVEARFTDLHAPELREPHENPWLTRGGDERLIEWRCLTLPQPDETSPWFLVGFGIDVTERRQAEERLALQARQQAAIAALGQKALIGEPLQDLMDEAAQAVADTLGNEFVKVLELLPGGDRLLLRAGVGWNDGLIGTATVSTGQTSQAGYTLLSGEPIIVTDLAAETRFNGPPLLTEHGVVSGISCAIVGTGGEPYGVLGTHTRRRREFTPGDVAFLQGIANILGAVIQRGHFEKGLRQSEAKHRAVVDTAVDAIMTIDEQGIVQTVNPAAEQLFGYAAGEMIGRNVKLLMPSPYREEHDDYLGRYLATGEKRIIGIGREVIGLRKDGTTFPIDLAVAEASFGEQRLFVGFLRDITERKQTEERFRLVVESAPNAIVMVNAAGTVVLVNSQAERFFGYGREEIVGQPVEILVPDLLRANHPSYRASFFESPSIRPMGAGRDLYGQRKDGSEFPVEIGLTPIQTRDGFLVLSAIVDISERKQAEETLRSSHAQLAADLAVMAKLQELSNRLVQDDNPEGLLPSVLEAAIAITSADMGKIQLLDHESGELKTFASRGFDPPFLEFFHAVGKGQAACSITMQDRERVVIEDIIVSPIINGTPALDAMLAAGVRAIQCTPLVNRSGRLVGILSTHYRKPHVPAEKELQVIDLLARQAADWIERTEADEELRRSHDGLQTLVNELQAKNEEIRTTTQQLWQAAKLASVGELAASIAHELNNPLATMTLRIESLLEDMPEEDPNRRALQIVKSETKRMSSLVANLLQFSRRGQEQISTVDIRQELTSTIELIIHQLKKRQIAVVQELAPDTPFIFADRQKLRQVFLNLFTNASDAMPQGGTLTLRSRAEMLAEGKVGVRIEVADTGIGIPPDHLTKVFDPYFTTKEEGQGTGLGLPICRRIVEEHRGTIRIESEAGKGSVVIITLPIRNEPNASRMGVGFPVNEG